MLVRCARLSTRGLFTQGHGRRCMSSQLANDIFGDAQTAEIVATAGGVDSIPKLHGLPEVIVTGRANVGKSSLLNAVLGRNELVRTSHKAGKTRTLNFFRVGAEPGRLVVVDAPGYGARGRPEWGELFDHYIDTRKELKRIYILFNGKHGLNEADKTMLAALSARVASHGGAHHTLQAVITKIDSVPLQDVRAAIRRIRRDVFAAAPLCLPPLVTSARDHPFVGVDELRASIIGACGVARAVPGA